jgi:iron-sulfur cluster assembly protein
MPNPRPSAITLTDRAAERLKEIVANSDGDIIGLRLGVKSRGCAGLGYTMDYARELNPGDEIIEDKGVKILVDPKAILFLLGTEMDFRTDKLSSGFVFNNPNETAACGCGESVSITPVAEGELFGA